VPFNLQVAGSYASIQNVMNEQKTTAVFRYALAVVSESEDPLSRQLGPIHLIKYAYLVDVEYARFNRGETFTGIEWTFHNFGPWSIAANALIAASLCVNGIRATRRPSDYGKDDWVRWEMDASKAQEFDAGLPLDIRGTLDKYVRQFGSDTYSLLHYVYTTYPILRAAPGETLDFGPPATETPARNERFVPLMDRLPRQKKTELSAKMSELRTRFQARHANVRRAVVRERHDADFSEAAAWVNSLSGPAFPDGESQVEFDAAVWKSEARRGHAFS
jgi:hypothetical protein